MALRSPECSLRLLLSARPGTAITGRFRRQIVAQRETSHWSVCTGQRRYCLIGRAPPAGFEPAHTAPERVASYGPDQRKRAPEHAARARIGHRRQGLERSAEAASSGDQAPPDHTRSWPGSRRAFSPGLSNDLRDGGGHGNVCALMVRRSQDDLVGAAL